MTGRPTLLTQEVHDRIIQAIRMGATYKLAAQYGGASYAGFNKWRKRGLAEIARLDENPRAKLRKREAPFVNFVKALKEAEGAAAVGWLAKIEKAASDGNWQAAAWKLERRYPQDYGRRVQEVTGDIEVSINADDARAAILSKIASIADAGDGE